MDEHFQLDRVDPWVVHFASWAHDTTGNRPLDFHGAEVPVKVQALLQTQQERERRFERIGETAAYIVFCGLAILVVMGLVAAGFWLIGQAR